MFVPRPSFHFYNRGWGIEGSALADYTYYIPGQCTVWHNTWKLLLRSFIKKKKDVIEENLKEKYALFSSLHSTVQTASSFQITGVLPHSLVKSLHYSSTSPPKKNPKLNKTDRKKRKETWCFSFTVALLLFQSHYSPGVYWQHGEIITLLTQADKMNRIKNKKKEAYIVYPSLLSRLFLFSY